MIRINLLAAERERAKKKAVTLGTAGQKLTIGCSLILVARGRCSSAGATGRVTRDSAQLDAEIAAAQQETTRLHSVIQQVQQFEQRKAQLQQRVVLIEQLRKGQTGPVHMLDQISRALPPMLWLTELKQTGDRRRDRRQVHDADRPVGLRRRTSKRRATSSARSRSSAPRPRRCRTPPSEMIKFTHQGAVPAAGRARSRRPAEAAVPEAAWHRRIKGRMGSPRYGSVAKLDGTQSYKTAVVRAGRRVRRARAWRAAARSTTTTRCRCAPTWRRASRS